MVLIAILFTPLIGVQIANAATLESATIKLISDGTGHGTKDARKINSKNGYPVADDGPNDGVVSTNDTVKYKLSLKIEAGPDRTISVKVDAPGFETTANSGFCTSGAGYFYEW